jgi:polysaccharide deacetylase family protein (PEP-CTERM system associated)
MRPAVAEPARRVLLSVQVEDYFQVGAFDGLIDRSTWSRFETRVDLNTHRTLDLLDQFGVEATFFVLGWVAERFPALVREIVARGHEVASEGYYHRPIRQMTPKDFREDVVRARDALEQATGVRVMGHRVPHFLGPCDLWALDVLAREGYTYDSSVRPLLRRFAHQPWRHRPHRHIGEGGGLWEVPPSAWSFFGLMVPLSGGNYFRQLPHTLVRRLVRRWHQQHGAPFVMYFHVWELDPEQPRISASSLVTRVRHYRNLGKMNWMLPDYFREYAFSGIANYLGLAQTPADPSRADRPPLLPERPPVRRRPEPVRVGPRTPVTVVVPCYNEEKSLGYLARALGELDSRLKARYEVSFILVDDGSEDGTWPLLDRLFGEQSRFTLRRHKTNRGVGAAILTGIRAARSEIVCSMDCDCSYDPNELDEMIPKLAPSVACVTASPYHPAGRVLNVPRWRLGLSHGASFLYRRVLRHKLWTYTSCFRVYRRSALTNLDLTEGGFLGVVETLAHLDLAGHEIVEHPTTLAVRLLGHSKMKAARGVADHLRLLARLAWRRAAGPIKEAPRICPPMSEPSKTAAKKAARA